MTKPKGVTFTISEFMYNRIFPKDWVGNRSSRIRDLLVLGWENENGDINRIIKHKEVLTTHITKLELEIRNLKRDLALSEKRYKDLKEKIDAKPKIVSIRHL